MLGRADDYVNGLERAHHMYLDSGEARRACVARRTQDGLRLVEETMVAVTTGELSPIVAGIVYCNTIAFLSTYELRRAREWTAALTRRCEHQPDMVAHNGLCLVHRA